MTGLQPYQEDMLRCLRDVDFAQLEARVLAGMYNRGPQQWQRDLYNQIVNKDVEVTAKEKPEIVVAIDPAKSGADAAKAMAMVWGKSGNIVILDEFDLHIDNKLDDERRFFPLGDISVTGRLEADLDAAMWEALRGIPKPTQPDEAKPDNRKQRRIDAAKFRRKTPRGQRKRFILDIETYDPNRRQDWK